MKNTKIKVPKPHLSFSSNHSAAYSSEQALETTYNPREIVLSNKEIAEMKVFIDQSITKLVVGAENEGAKVDLTLLLSDQDCDKLNHNFKTEAGRRYFADVLNRLRSSVCDYMYILYVNISIYRKLYLVLDLRYCGD